MKLQNTYERLKKFIGDAWYYVQGTYRYKMIYNGYGSLIRNHIKEQFNLRKVKAKDCFSNGSCLYCGCKTPELFLANKECGLENASRETREFLTGRYNKCYGPMLNKKEWLNYKNKKR